MTRVSPRLKRIKVSRFGKVRTKIGRSLSRRTLTTSSVCFESSEQPVTSCLTSAQDFEWHMAHSSIGVLYDNLDLPIDINTPDVYTPHNGTSFPKMGTTRLQQINTVSYQFKGAYGTRSVTKYISYTPPPSVPCPVVLQNAFLNFVSTAPGTASNYFVVTQAVYNTLPAVLTNPTTLVSGTQNPYAVVNTGACGKVYIASDLNPPPPVSIMSFTVDQSNVYPSANNGTLKINVRSVIPTSKQTEFQVKVNFPGVSSAALIAIDPQPGLTVVSIVRAASNNRWLCRVVFDQNLTDTSLIFSVNGAATPVPNFLEISNYLSYQPVVYSTPPVSNVSSQTGTHQTEAGYTALQVNQNPAGAFGYALDTKGDIWWRFSSPNPTVINANLLLQNFGAYTVYQVNNEAGSASPTISPVYGFLPPGFFLGYSLNWPSNCTAGVIKFGAASYPFSLFQIYNVIRSGLFLTGSAYQEINN